MERMIKMGDYHKKYTYIHTSQSNLIETENEALLEKANEYFRLVRERNAIIRELDKIKGECQIAKKELTDTCPHKYEAEPREYQSAREWACSICGDRV